MKNLILAFALIIGISFTANAQTSSKKEKKEKQKMEMKHLLRKMRSAIIRSAVQLF